MNTDMPSYYYKNSIIMVQIAPVGTWYFKNGTECLCWHRVLSMVQSAPVGTEYFMEHATPTGPRPVPWNQKTSGTEMGV